jgi:putative transposase
MDNKRTRHSAYNINYHFYHFLWCPKFRRPILVDRLAVRLEELIREKTAELGGEVFKLTVMSGYVHLFRSFPPTMAPYQIMHRLKGYTAHVLRREFPELNSRLPNLWARSCYCGTAGNVSAATIQRYLDEQKGS